jgi:hypothetical protein
LLAWLLHREQRSLQSMIVVFLDELARDWRLTKNIRQTEPQPPPPPASTDSPFAKSPGPTKQSEPFVSP